MTRTWPARHATRGHHRAEPDLDARVVPSVGQAPDERAIALADPVRRVAVVVLRRFVLGQRPGAQPRQVGGMEPLEILDHALDLARAARATSRARGSGRPPGDRGRRDRPRAASPARRECPACAARTGAAGRAPAPRCRSSETASSVSPGLADQLHQLRRPAVDELGAELDGDVQAGVVHGVDAAADPVAGLEHHDAAARPPPAARPRRAPRCRRPATTTSALGIRSRRLLVPQRDDRIEPRGAAGGPDAEEEPDQRAEAERHDDGRWAR